LVLRHREAVSRKVKKLEKEDNGTTRKERAAIIAFSDSTWVGW
jgi:hypothetical protein